MAIPVEATATFGQSFVRQWAGHFTEGGSGPGILLNGGAFYWCVPVSFVKKLSDYVNLSRTLKDSRHKEKDNEAIC